MAKGDTARDALTKWVRRIARGVGSLVAAFWLFMGVAHGIHETGPMTLESVIMAVLMVTSISGVCLAWWREGTGGTVVLLSGVAHSTFAYFAAGHNTAYAMLISGGPFLLIGSLFLTSYYRSEIMRMNVQATLALRYFGFRKIPMLYFVRASVVELTLERAVVKIPLRRRTRNHLHCMYFGALAIGADCSAGLLALKCIRDRKERISPIFKDLKAEFRKRAEGDVLFSCDQGKDIAELVDRAANTDERVEMPVKVIATVPSRLGDEPVARFELTLSLKRK
jgi:hypothetical protein